MNHIFKFKFLVIVFAGLLMAGLCLAQGQPKKLAITKGPHVSYISETAVEIKWETNKEASGFVEYGTDSSMTDTVSVDEVSEEHEVELTDLQPEMEYLYRVVAIDTSGTDTFRTRILKFTTGNDENESPHIEIIDGKKDIAVGDTVQFKAIYKNNHGVEFDTTFVWSVKPDSLGEIDSTGLFVAMTPGTGFIYAQLGDLVDSTEIEIKEDDSDGDNETPRVEIIDGKKDIAVGDTVQFKAIYKNNRGVEFDTTFVWSVKPDSLGEIDSTGLFIAMTPGTGFIYAQLGDLVDSTEIEIKEDDSGKDDDEKGKNDRFVVIPGDTTVEVGSVIQFNAYYKNDQDVLVDTVAQWSLSGSPIGTISEDGELNVIAPGIGFVKAKLDNWEEVVLVTAVNTDVDSSSLNTIKISRVFPDGKVLPPHIVHEGEIYNIGGLQPPFHLLNGGKVYFPYGCLNEDIVIHIKLPEFANVENDTVKFGRKMVNGIRFDVFVDDTTLVEPYFFNEPLFVAIPFKRGLIKQLGIDPANLSMFFASDSVTLDSIGISGVVVDSAANRIFGFVEHFSTVVIAEKSAATTGLDNTNEDQMKPRQLELMQNYPNPFNPETLIRFQLPERSHVSLKIYNLIGQEIVTLINRNVSAGSHAVKWDGNDMFGRRVSSGIYIYRIEAGQIAQTRKMTLIR